MTEPRIQANADTTSDQMIARKVAAAHSEQFRQRFPSQLEHCQRLIAERLQLGLRKDTVPGLTAEEIRDLTASLHTLVDIQRNYM
jgi:nitric oxide reductase activation protein